MGISRRKAGSVVQCPRCAGQVIVPDPNPHPKKGSPKESRKEPAVSEESADGLHQPSNSAGEIFERSDIGKLLQQEPIAYNPPQKTHSGGNGSSVAPPLLESRVSQRQAVPVGIVLTPFRMTLLAVGIVLLLGLAFFAGFLVGRNP